MKKRREICIYFPVNDLGDEFFLMTSQANVNNDELLTPNLDEKLDLNSNQIYSSETPSFSPNEQSIMITNLDDILIDDDADESDQHPFKSSANFLLDNSFRRPIQEDILYEVEHENSFSEHSQNASSMFIPNEMVCTILGFLSVSLYVILSTYLNMDLISSIHQPDVYKHICLYNHLLFNLFRHRSKSNRILIIF